MPVTRLENRLRQEIDHLVDRGAAKGAESVVAAVISPEGDRGPRFVLAGEGNKRFIRMNSNSYLGMGLREEVLRAEEEGARAYGSGPGAVRFISGTYAPHVELERRLAEFHGRESAMIFSSAYATMMGVLPPLITGETAVISDELNHNCIINAMRLARPASKHIYAHNDLQDLERCLKEAADSGAQRAVVVTDGIFSMRGDYAPLDAIADLVRRFDDRFPEDAVLAVDDSHGVGAIGETGRGTEEHTGAGKVDVLVATLGKALGVNGGYVVGSETLTTYLREKAPFYIYSNPITPGEAAAAQASLDLLDSPRGRDLLAHLRAMTERFEQGLVDAGFETIAGPHPVVPLMVRDTERTAALVAHLKEHGVLATGLNFPVVPRGDEEIRFQINADHTAADVDRVVEVLRSFQG
ncbi:MAG: aminotransferase class I/II-fold pyridoxal phosphate-dependent enzyme [Myxococcota bacterium]